MNFPLHQQCLQSEKKNREKSIVKYCTFVLTEKPNFFLLPLLMSMSQMNIDGLAEEGQPRIYIQAVKLIRGQSPM